MSDSVSECWTENLSVMRRHIISIVHPTDDIMMMLNERASDCLD